MLNTFGNTNEPLRILAEKAAGLRYDSPEAEAILDKEDWADHWPVVDANGCLTGDVVETADCEGYSNVCDMAMIADEDLRPEQRPGPNEVYAKL